MTGLGHIFARRSTDRRWSAAEGQAEGPCENADMRARISGVGGLPAVASASSGLVLASLGYDALCLIAALLLVIPVRVIGKHRRALAAGS